MPYQVAGWATWSKSCGLLSGKLLRATASRWSSAGGRPFDQLKWLVQIEVASERLFQLGDPLAHEALLPFQVTVGVMLAGVLHAAIVPGSAASNRGTAATRLP